MAALTASYDPHPKDAKVVSYPMAANTTVYKGGLVNISGGYAVPAADAANESFAGVAHETKANVASTPLPGGGGFAGAAGALSIRVHKTGAFLYNRAGSAVTDIGKAVQIVDDNHVATTGTTNAIAAGYITEVPSATQVRVRIDRAVQ